MRTYDGGEADRRLRDLERLLRRTEEALRMERIQSEKYRFALSDSIHECHAWRALANDIILNMNGDLVAVWAKHRRVTSKL